MENARVNHSTMFVKDTRQFTDNQEKQYLESHNQLRPEGT